MKYKVYSSNAGAFKKRRRRIGEFTKTVSQFKRSLTVDQLIALELKTL